MAFDVKKIKKTKFSSRESDVSVPELTEFFDADEPAVWKVRNLSGMEVGQVNETAKKYQQIEVAQKALVGTHEEKIKAFKSIFGVVDGLSEEMARRTEVLILGSVSPECDKDLAGIIREKYPLAFVKITDKIYEMTGLGAVPGKPKPSTKGEK